MKFGLLYIPDYYPERYKSASHYYGEMTAAGVAARVRSIANQVTLRELWDKARMTAWR